MLMHANKREDVETASAGEIVAIGGMKYHHRDTIADESKLIILESMDFEPHSVASNRKHVRPGQNGYLNRLAQEDPVSASIPTTKRARRSSPEWASFTSKSCRPQKREFGVEANVGKPQVAYRETITASAPVKDYKKQSGGRGKFGHVELEIEPAPGEGFVFEDKISGGSIPRQFIKPTMEGIRDAMGRGFLAGYELVDIKVRLLFGSYHEVDSDEISFKLAGSFAFQDAVKKAKPILLEPIMRIEVVTPEEYGSGQRRS